MYRDSLTLGRDDRYVVLPRCRYRMRDLGFRSCLDLARAGGLGGVDRFGWTDSSGLVLPSSLDSSFLSSGFSSCFFPSFFDFLLIQLSTHDFPAFSSFEAT